MPHQSDAFEELDACDDVRESSYHRDRKNELYPIFKGQNKQRLFGTSQFRVSKSRSFKPRIKSYPNSPKRNQHQHLTERKAASVFGWIVSAFSPHKTKRTYRRNENNALLLVKRERREGRPSSGEESGAAQRKQGGANTRRGRRCLFFFEKEN